MSDTGPATPEGFVEAIKELVETARVSDLSGVSSADLASLVDRVRATTSRMAAHVVDGVRMQATLDMGELLARAEIGHDRFERVTELGVAGVFPYSPYIGPLNPLSPDADLTIVAGDPWHELVGRARFGDAFNGPPGSVHGGVLSGILDEMLGAVAVVNDVAGFTGTLTVRYSSVTPLNEEISLRAWIDRVEGRKTFAGGSLHHEGRLCVEAEGVFIAATDLQAPRPRSGDQV